LEKTWLESSSESSQRLNGSFALLIKERFPNFFVNFISIAKFPPLVAYREYNDLELTVIDWDSKLAVEASELSR
jgi:hypothetical protein